MNPGSGCVAVCRVVTSDTRGSGFESCLQQIYLLSTVFKGREVNTKYPDLSSSQVLYKQKLVLMKTSLLQCIKMWQPNLTETKPRH